MTNTKKKHGNKMKLLSAVGMLTVSAAMLVSSTFAWFSMNKKVTATSLQVTAKSNSQYLIIDSVDNATNKSTSDLTKDAAFVNGGTNAADASASPAVVANTDKIVYPTYYAAAAGNMPGTADGTTSLAVTAGHWYTANNKNSNNANNATMNVLDLGTNASPGTGVTLANYMCTYNSWLSLTEDSEDYTGTINVKSTLASGDAGTSVVVVLSDGTTTETLKLANGTATATTNSFTLTSTSSVAVTYYVYIDGTTTNVYSDYINGGTQLTGNLSVEFDIS